MAEIHNLEEILVLNKPITIELGCGERKRHIDAIGIDAISYPGVDLVGDVFEVLKKFPSECVDEVYSYHFIEHVQDIDNLMSELSRIVKVGGIVEFVAPHFSNPYFYSDPTHRRYFGLYTFCYLANSSLFKRSVPNYNKQFQFELEKVDLHFKSSRPFYIRYGIKYVIGKIFNSCAYLKELYEENLSFLFPCYEIRYRLRKLPVNR